MNTDIRIAVSFRNHRKRRKLRLVLGDNSTDYLIDLWLSTAMNHPDGKLVGMDEVDIALEAGWEKDPAVFVDGLMRCGFLDRDESGTYVLHDWEDHQGYAIFADARTEKARKAAKIRWGKPAHAPSIEKDATSNAPSIENPCPYPAPNPSPNPAPFSFPPTPLSSEPEALPPPEPKKEKKGGEVSEARFISVDWEPDAKTVDACIALGIPAEFASQQVPVFRLWHLEAGTKRPGFEALFVGWAKKAWLERAPPAATTPTYTARPKHMTLLEWDEYQRRQLYASESAEPDPFASVFQRQPAVPALPALEGSYERTH